MAAPERLHAAYESARRDLLAERKRSGHWEGRLASSPLSTATAISALVLAEQHGHELAEDDFSDAAYQGDLSELVVESLHWLARHQNDDGGWGDTDCCRSNIATTMLVAAAFHLTGVPVKFADLLEKADAYIERAGGIPALKARYGPDRTFAVPILTNCALAERVPWKKVPALPFELACLPQKWYRRLRLPVVSYAVPALVAIGQAHYFHRKPWDPLRRFIRGRAVQPSLDVLQRMQPESGGFLEAVPLTSFVVMSLASTGRGDHPVCRRGVEFLLGSVRADASWPIDTNLATWNTTLAVNSLAHADDDASDGEEREPSEVRSLELLEWLLGCQQREAHPYTGAEPGGWAWTDLSGGVPDADDTAGALLALAGWQTTDDDERRRIASAAEAGVTWLLDLQNDDGGWPTFCRGWGKLPFDRSGADLTAHALRALRRWRDALTGETDAPHGSENNGDPPSLAERLATAEQTGLRYLQAQQQSDGSWIPLWFGNQFEADETNPIYGTSRVLLALAALGHSETDAARRGLNWLAAAQQADGGWGGGAAATEKGWPAQASSVEETALACEALLAVVRDPSLQVALDQGLEWLAGAVEEGRHREPSPIGFYFARLWYHEALYPLIFTVSALGQAIAAERSGSTPHLQSARI